ncbi:hypothetical protein BDV93DRAFT_606297 [Ceratobasidium sp. AG-I]|nr:hypothetical protein BDV93DRAFT_606297 [Ceratobasidium sp. AG-I]
MPLRVGRRLRQLISQTLRTQHPTPPSSYPPLTCPASTTAPVPVVPSRSRNPPKFKLTPIHNSKLKRTPIGQPKPKQLPPTPPVPEKDPLRERINALLSAPTNPETAEQLAELKLTPPTDGKLICLLAEALAHHAFVPDAIALLAHARAQGIPIRPALYEPVVYRLVRRHRWADVLALLEPLQSLVPPTLESHTQKKLTTRLCEWRVKACAELGDFAGMERALGLFPRGISRRSWEVAERACMRNSDPKMAGKIREVLKLAIMVEGEGEGDVKGKGKDRDTERSKMEEIAQALVSRPGTQDDPSSSAQASHAIRISRVDTSDPPHPTFLISEHPNPSSPQTPSSDLSFTPNARIATLCVKALVQENRVTEAATIVASMCKGVPVLEPSSSTSAPSTSSTPRPASVPLPEVFASVRPDIFVFNALLKGILDTRGLAGMISLLEIMQGTDVKPDSETGTILLRYLDRQRAWRPGQLIDALVDLTAPILPSPASDPSIPPKPRPLPISIRHTNVLLSSILNVERKTSLGGGWKAATAFLKYRTRPVDRYPPSDARLASPPDDIDPPTAGLQLRARAAALKPVLETLRSRGVRNDRMAYSLRAQRDGVVRLDPEMARTVLERAEIPLGAHHYAALMAGLVECGYMDAATTVMRASHAAGLSVDSPVMHTILITGYARMGQPREAQRVFEEMCKDGVKPDAIAVDALAGAWFVSGEYRRAREVVIEHWPGDGALPFRSNAPLKEIMTELRKLRPASKVRKKRTGRVEKDEEESVERIVKAIKSPDKVLPLTLASAVGEKKDTGSSGRRFSSMAGLGADGDGDGQPVVRGAESESDCHQRGESSTGPRARVLLGLKLNGYG